MILSIIMEDGHQFLKKIWMKKNKILINELVNLIHFKNNRMKKWLFMRAKVHLILIKILKKIKTKKMINKNNNKMIKIIKKNNKSHY